MADDVLEFFFDIGSPYSYFAAKRIAPLTERTGAQVWWRPILLGGIYKALDHPIGLPPHRLRYANQDLDRWSRHLEIPFRMPSGFPVNTIVAQRALVGAGRLKGDPDPMVQSGVIARFADALFEANYTDDRDITMPEVVADVAETVGLDGERILALTKDSETKAALRATSDEAVERGVFGAPTFIWKDELFWGQDRMMFVELAIRETTG